MKRCAFTTLALVAALSACGEEPAKEEQVTAAEQGGEAAGDVAGGTISDAMIPLESLTSQSPTLRRQTTTVTSTTGANGESSTTVETTTTVTNAGQEEAPAPTTPEPPTPPGGRL